MRRLILLFICGAALDFAIAAAPQDGNPAANNGKSAKAGAPAKPLTAIPASAVQIEPGAYRWTDEQGKKWILFQTPFGIASKEDTGAPLRNKQREPEVMQGVKIAEDGDSLKFEREGPFGVYKWTKKKTELSEEEKSAWERQKADAAKTQDPAAPKNAAAKQDR